MKILLLEPFFTGSHASWASEYVNCSRHQVEILSLPGKHWKWRMHGGAVALAGRFLESSSRPDLILATDMLDLTTFLALTRSKTASCKTAIYFHENQLTYPWSPNDKDNAIGRDMHYAFINYSSALAADAVFFNSFYHMNSFMAELPSFLRSMPDKREWRTIEAIGKKSSVLSLGMDLRQFDDSRQNLGRSTENVPLVLWNHRWEYDKNPEAFFAILDRVAANGVDFQLAIVGERFSNVPAIFDIARERMGNRIVQYGFVESFAEYAYWLWKADILPVTSRHDFFGASVVQAIYCGCCPLLPKRLAYPEHLPEEHRRQFLYEDENDLEERLVELLRGNASAPPELLRQFVSRYDWQTMASVYDDVFERLMAGGSLD